MAGAVGRFCVSGFLRPNSISLRLVSQLSTAKGWTRGRKLMWSTVGVVGGGVGALILALEQSVRASGLEAHPPKNPWSHLGMTAALDHASVRRGYEVYKQVCAACHAMKYLHYRHLVDVTHTEAEAKAEAAEVMVEDGPDETGAMFKRPGKLHDAFPSPYPNEEAARHANNGAYPPDLSYMANARHGGEDYIFSLLTGYTETPAGIQPGEGQHFNPYFPGGLISMAQALYNEAAEYSDGTPATASQMAKDMCTFLRWSAEPEFDERKRMLIKINIVGIGLFAVLWYYKRHKWTTLKTRKLAFKPPSPRD